MPNCAALLAATLHGMMKEGKKPLPESNPKSGKSCIFSLETLLV
jgi:hypothetical protein